MRDEPQHKRDADERTLNEMRVSVMFFRRFGIRGRYWEHCIKDERNYEQHVNYIHYNPVKHGYVNKAVDWEYFSIHRYVANGMIPKDWGISTELATDLSFGERL